MVKESRFSGMEGSLTLLDDGYIIPEVLRGLINEEESVVYVNVQEKIDILYSAIPTGIKEYIILNESTEQNEFTFKINVEGVSGVQEESGILFLDDEGKEVFRLSGMYAFDSNKKATGDIQYILEENGGGTEVKLVINKEWLSSSERQYPIIIDPSVMVSGADTTYDACICSYYPDTNYYVDANLRTGKDEDFGIRRSLIKFDLPSGIGGSQITSAYVRIKMHGGYTPSMYAYRITSSWSSSSVTWNNQPSYTTTDSSAVAFDDSDNWYSMNITTITRGWMNGNYSNLGIMVKDSVESTESHWSTFYSSDASYPNRPELVINYSTSGVSEEKGLMRYIVTADLSQEDTAEVRSIVSNFSAMGFNPVYWYDCPTPAFAYAALPEDTVSIIHGHGSDQGGIAFYNKTTGTNEWFRSYTGTYAIGNYSLTGLEKTKFIAFISCNSAYGPNRDLSKGFPAMAYKRGAAFALGFRVSVSEGEGYILMVTDYLKQGDTIGVALQKADDEFHIKKNKKNCDDENCPAHSDHRYTYGNRGNKLV